MVTGVRHLPHRQLTEEKKSKCFLLQYREIVTHHIVNKKIKKNQSVLLESTETSSMLKCKVPCDRQRPYENLYENSGVGDRRRSPGTRSLMSHDLKRCHMLSQNVGFRRHKT